MSKPSYEDLYQKQVQLKEIDLAQWKQDDLFSLNWWMLLIVMLTAWTICWKIVDRKRVVPVLLYGAFVALCSSFLDVLGTSLALWGYPDRLVPLIPPFFIFDFVTLPVVLLWVYQKYGPWARYLIAATIVSGIFSFVLEPFLAWRGMYRLHHWEYYYSFPIYIAIAALLKKAVDLLVETQKKHAPP
ncbi:hypothetical protein EV586_104136 [Tumebacillus sp. BK434]|uniref:CBO0543 family protein n=1 Tax=Tumebacillus sp. BK434 TaxID=2512169 RepID=UPI00104CFAD7|nr:CBO0543 family protein [Tumebacillus sp. BK434]TCP54518.1 hypothetical protein EV586_104136 [Tumebacillus sp. BK434]